MSARCAPTAPRICHNEADHISPSACPGLRLTPDNASCYQAGAGKGLSSCRRWRPTQRCNRSGSRRAVAPPMFRPIIAKTFTIARLQVMNQNRDWCPELNDHTRAKYISVSASSTPPRPNDISLELANRMSCRSEAIHCEHLLAL